MTVSKRLLNAFDMSSCPLDQSRIRPVLPSCVARWGSQPLTIMLCARACTSVAFSPPPAHKASCSRLWQLINVEFRAGARLAGARGSNGIVRSHIRGARGRTYALVVDERAYGCAQVSLCSDAK